MISTFQKSFSFKNLIADLYSLLEKNHSIKKSSQNKRILQNLVPDSLNNTLITPLEIIDFEKCQLVKNLSKLTPNIKNASFLGTQRDVKNEKENKLLETESKLKKLLNESKQYLSHKSKSPINITSRNIQNVKTDENFNGSFRPITPNIDKSFIISKQNTRNTEHAYKTENQKYPTFSNKSPLKKLFIDENKNSPIQKQAESPIFMCSQNDTQNSSDLIATLTTEELFKKYIGNTKTPTKAQNINPKSTIIEKSYKTKLRYINYKDLLHDLQEIGLENENIIYKQDFINCIENLLSKLRFGKFITKNTDLEELFDVFDNLSNMPEKSKNGTKIEEIIGGLCVICKGNIEEKIELALICMGSKNGQINLEILTTFMRSIFKICNWINSTKTANISIFELAEKSALQCFDDNHKHYSDKLTFYEFKTWFNSVPTKTLAPLCSQPNSPYEPHKSKVPKINLESIRKKQQIEVLVEPASIDSMNELFGENTENDTTYQHQSILINEPSEIKDCEEISQIGNLENEEPLSEIRQQVPLPNPHPIYPIPTTIEARIPNSTRNTKYTPRLMQKRWEQFLTWYYKTYGFYPPPPPTCFGEQTFSTKNTQSKAKTKVKQNLDSKNTTFNDFSHNHNDSLGSESTYDIMKTYTNSCADPGSSRFYENNYEIPQSSRNCTFRPNCFNC